MYADDVSLLTEMLYLFLQWGTGKVMIFWGHMERPPHMWIIDLEVEESSAALQRRLNYADELPRDE